MHSQLTSVHNVFWLIASISDNDFQNGVCQGQMTSDSVQYVDKFRPYYTRAHLPGKASTIDITKAHSG